MLETRSLSPNRRSISNAADSELSRRRQAINSAASVPTASAGLEQGDVIWLGHLSLAGPAPRDVLTREELVFFATPREEMDPDISLSDLVLRKECAEIVDEREAFEVQALELRVLVLCVQFASEIVQRKFCSLSHQSFPPRPEPL